MVGLNLLVGKRDADLPLACHSALFRNRPPNVLSDVEDVTLPTTEKIDECVRGLVAGTDVQIKEMPLTIEAARSSLHKILHKRQPSDKKEQFTDGVIWANCLELLEESDVWLQSAHGGDSSCKDCQVGHGLASNLKFSSCHDLAYPNNFKTRSADCRRQAYFKFRRELSMPTRMYCQDSAIFT